MTPTREAVMTALVALLETTTFVRLATTETRFRRVSRRLKLWTDVPPSEQPALFITEHDENLAYQSEGLPGKTTMGCDLFIYFATGKDKNATPSIDLNHILDGIDAVLKPAAAYGFKQTLGGLVSHVRIEGKIFKDPGDTDDQGLIVIPLKIFVP
jgi:hypothetical protein